MLKIKRAYERKEENDGERILVDRLWPRGVRKADAAINEWIKDLAPSNDLRIWFGHNPDRWEEFKRRYRSELSTPENKQLLEDIAQAAISSNITLVYAARDTEHNNARVLQEIVDEMMKARA